MSETSERVDRVREAIRARGLDGLLVTHPSNRVYLTGFTGEDIAPNESSGHLLITATAATLVTGSVNTTQAESQAPHIRVITREGAWSEADAKVIAESGAKRIGYESQAMLDGVFRGVNEELEKSALAIAWEPADGIVESFRAVKSPSEVALLRRAFEITNAAFERVAPTIQIGDSEWDVSWRIHMAMVELGAEGPSFPTIVAAGTHAARPHHEPGKRRIRQGEPIVIDMGARYQGYCADLTRTVWFGNPDPTLQEVYPVVAEAVEQVLERIQPGMSGTDMDAAARDFITSRGYGDAFTHGLGHGVGVRVHEAPSASKQSKDVLAAGNVITVEPGVYLPDWGGVRVEDVVLITEDGIEVLTTASKMQI
ncbi:MAG TPA: Xaa-Pro peptidase family protein [Thermomicrobiales bacterium]|nr:Xaa-Pro peptidase family protein [Thermomicrobiales bacterium]